MSKAQISFSKLVRAFLMGRMQFNRGYGLVASFGMPFLVACELQERLKKFWDISIPIWQLLVVATVGLWVAGFLWLKTGLWGQEMDMNIRINPGMRRVIENAEKE